MSMLRKVTLFLGLAPDEEFEEYDEPEERPLPVGPPRTRGTVQPMQRTSGNVARSVAAQQSEADRQQQLGSVRPLPITESPAAGHRSPVVRPVPNPALARPNVVSPANFTDAQEIADRFKASQPVIMNLQGLERDLSRRLIDFASGLCYGLSGDMEKVANQVFLLTPADVEVPAEERRKIQERGVAEQ